MKKIYVYNETNEAFYLEDAEGKQIKIPKGGVKRVNPGEYNVTSDDRDGFIIDTSRYPDSYKYIFESDSTIRPFANSMPS